MRATIQQTSMVTLFLSEREARNLFKFVQQATLVDRTMGDEEFKDHENFFAGLKEVLDA